MKRRPDVVVMMSTFNGAEFLDAQLESIFGQRGVVPHLYVRDDASTDDTVERLLRYSEEHDADISVLTAGPEGNVGVYQSWNLLIPNIPRHFDYFAISDQDDVWLPSKLQEAVRSLEARADSVVLYTCNTTAVTSEMRVIRRYDFSARLPTLPSLFARYSIPAHAMVFGKGLMRLVDSYDSQQVATEFTLEQRLLLTTLAVGGDWVRDDKSYVLWRRQPGNVTAAGNGLGSRVSSEFAKFRAKGVRTSWALSLLRASGVPLTPESREFLELVVGAHASFAARLRLATSPELSTGRVFFDAVARLRALLPDW